MCPEQRGQPRLDGHTWSGTYAPMQLTRSKQLDALKAAVVQDSAKRHMPRRELGRTWLSFAAALSTPAPGQWRRMLRRL
jgi:hypothetical protein